MVMLAIIYVTYREGNVNIEQPKRFNAERLSLEVYVNVLSRRSRHVCTYVSLHEGKGLT